MSRYRAAKAELWRYPLSGPTGGSGVTAVDLVVVDLEDDRGRSGTGFSYALGGGGAAVLAAARDLLERLVLDAPCIPPQALWRRLAASLDRLGRGTGYVAIAAIDLAAWDLHAKTFAQPLYAALGGVRRTVPVYGSGGFRPDQPPDETLAQTLRYAERGCKAVKLRVAGAPADVDRMRIVAEGRPADIDVMVDANQRCDLPRARWLAGQCARAGALFLEEPLPASELAAYSALAARSPVAIAAGEHLQGVAEVAPFLDERALAIVQPDLAMMGGLSECFRAAQVAEARGVSVTPHFLPALFVHLACACPNVTWLEDFPLLEPLFRDPVTMNDAGEIGPSETPGHGFRWADGAREEFRSAM